METPNYYAIIPANVRYAKINANAKLLYGEITALCNKEGYCWANNNYFANLYDVDNRSITRRLSELNGKGFISIQIDKEGGNKRKIYLSTISSIPMDKIVDTPMDKTVQHNNTSNNNINTNGANENFEELRLHYPNKKNKHKARDVYAKKVLSPETHELVVKGIEMYKKDKSAKSQQGKFVEERPHLATFINQERWLDIESEADLMDDEFYSEEMKRLWGGREPVNGFGREFLKKYGEELHNKWRVRYKDNFPQGTFLIQKNINE